MNRLTKQWGKDNVNCVATELDYLCLVGLEEHEFLAFDKIVRKLAYYEDLEESGKLFKTPYKLNDVVYVINEDDKIEEVFIDGFEIRRLRDGFELFVLIPIYDDIRQVGCKTILNDGVFLTREDAEEKLKEME